MKRKNNGEGTVLPDAAVVKIKSAAKKSAPKRKVLRRKSAKAKETRGTCKSAPTQQKPGHRVPPSETITYQGRRIRARVINYLSGRIPTSSLEMEGDEELLRDKAGRYYLRRRLTHIDADGENERRASRRTLLHRINVNAAILWATTRLNSDTLDLRKDAADLLMEGRGYSDPHPSHLSAEQRAMVSDPERFAKQGEPGSGRITVELDDLASTLLRRVCWEGNGCREAGEDPRDLVNAAVTFYLCGEDNDQHGNFDLNDSSDALERAKHDRLARATNARQADTDEPTPTTAPASPREVTVTIPLRGQPPGVHRFTFDYSATEKVCGRRRVVELSDEQMERARELAAHFDLSAEAFLGGLADNNDLPGQPRRSNNKLEDVIQAADITFVCMDKAMAERIERAAQSCKRTVNEFVADAVGRDVDMYEEAILVHPTTGALLEDDFEVLYEDGQPQITVGPLGRENDPQFVGYPGRQYVSFGVYLSPEQLERLEYPHMVTDCATDREMPCVLIPVDPEGNPHLSINGKYVKTDELSSLGEQAEASVMFVKLDDEASALVRRYLGVTPWNVTAEDIVSGSVTYALGQAFDNLEEAEQRTGLASDEVHDGGWGYVQSDIEDAKKRRGGTRGEPKILDDERTIGSRTVQIESVRSDTPSDELNRWDRYSHR